MIARRILCLVVGLVAVAPLVACGVKDDPDPPSGKKNVPAQIYPKPDPMPGMPAASPAPPATPRGRRS